MSQNGGNNSALEMLMSLWWLTVAGDATVLSKSLLLVLIYRLMTVSINAGARHHEIRYFLYRVIFCFWVQR